MRDRAEISAYNKGSGQGKILKSQRDTAELPPPRLPEEVVPINQHGCENPDKTTTLLTWRGAGPVFWTRMFFIGDAESLHSRPQSGAIYTQQYRRTLGAGKTALAFFQGFFNQVPLIFLQSGDLIIVGDLAAAQSDMMCFQLFVFAQDHCSFQYIGQLTYISGPMPGDQLFNGSGVDTGNLLAHARREFINEEIGQ
jgi:hypothetical protein